MSRAIVFVGPSLDGATARRLCDAAGTAQVTLRPPARMGDVYRAALEQPAAILIIDGYFEQVPSVWHKEVLFALSQGVRVLGAASMGALRAAELHSFGMQGVGRIFAAYADGVINDDDEVAVVHGQGGDSFALASEAMVNLRFALDDALAAGQVDAATHGQLIALAKARFYPQRSWPQLWQDAAEAGLDAATLKPLREHIEARQPNQKREDAIAGLQELLRQLARAEPAPVPNFTFEHTLYWDTVESYFRHAGVAADSSNGVATSERLRNHVRLFDPEREHTLERALLLALVEQEARRLRLGPGSDAQVLRGFRQRRGLQGSRALAQWMQQQGVTSTECLRLARAEHLLRGLALRHMAAVDAWLEPVLRLQGRWHEAVQAVQRKWQTLQAQGQLQLSEDDVGGNAEVLEWYQQRCGRLATDLEEHLGERGFASMRHFLDELYAEHWAGRAAAAAQRAAA